MLVGGCFLIFTYVDPANKVTAAEIHVMPDESIQAVIDRAEKGDTIIITNGVYKENITVTKTLSFIGEGGATIDGGGKGNVITIRGADRVSISRLTIKNSGREQTDSGISIHGGRNVQIKDNDLVNNHYGIYVDKGIHFLLAGNRIYGSDTHHSRRGNGIHLFKGGGHQLERNHIESVQDGVYFDFTKRISVVNNSIASSRYALHYMYSSDMIADGNKLVDNIIGLMVMDSANLSFLDNYIADHFHFHGHGAYIYHANNIFLKGNEIIRNSTGISFEKAIDTETVGNVIAANQVGLEFIGKNTQNIFTENNFIANIVQSKIANKGMRLDNGEIGNYWDDYGELDVSGDGIGESRYRAGSLYDQLLRSQPEWQFFFESPAVKLWSKAESLFPSIGAADVYDELPAVKPFPLKDSTNKNTKQRNGSTAFFGFLLIGLASFILYKGRRYV